MAHLSPGARGASSGRGGCGGCLPVLLVLGLLVLLAGGRLERTVLCFVDSEGQIRSAVNAWLRDLQEGNYTKACKEVVLSDRSGCDATVTQLFARQGGLAQPGLRATDVRAVVFHGYGWRVTLSNGVKLGMDIGAPIAGDCRDLKIHLV